MRGSDTTSSRVRISIIERPAWEVVHEPPGVTSARSPFAVANRVANCVASGVGVGSRIREGSGR